MYPLDPEERQMNGSIDAKLQPLQTGKKPERLLTCLWFIWKQRREEEKEKNQTGIWGLPGLTSQHYIWNMIKQRVVHRKTCMNNACDCCPLLLVFLSTSISVLYSILGLCTKVPYPQLQPPTKQAAFCPLQRDKKSQMKWSARWVGTCKRGQCFNLQRPSRLLFKIYKIWVACMKWTRQSLNRELFRW